MRSISGDVINQLRSVARSSCLIKEDMMLQDKVRNEHVSLGALSSTYLEDGTIHENTVNNRLAKLNRNIRVFNDNDNILHCVAMDPTTGKSYLTQRYPNIIEDIDNIMTTEDWNIAARLCNNYVSINRADWDSVNRMRSNVVNRWIESNPKLVDQKVLLIHNAPQLIAVETPYVVHSHIALKPALFTTNLSRRLQNLENISEEYRVWMSNAIMSARSLYNEKKVYVDFTVKNNYIYNLIRLLRNQRQYNKYLSYLKFYDGIVEDDQQIKFAITRENRNNLKDCKERI